MINKVNSRIGIVGVVVVALATLATTCSKSDELPRGLGERIARTLLDEGFPSAAAAFDTQVKINASDGEAEDWFGYSVAISGDTAIVGAGWDDDQGSSSGSAYVFRRDEGGVDNWGEITKITASDAADRDVFGSAVAISGDTVIVGAHHNSDDGYHSGSAYVYQRDEGGADNWGEANKITASNGVEFEAFGVSVAISGDTAIVGASSINYPEAQLGAAYVFFLSPGPSPRPPCPNGASWR